MNRVWMGLLIAACAVCLCTLPKIGTDAAKLLPAQVLVISQENGQISVESDNGASGSGPTLPDALTAMSESAEGTLFLDTAEHIILLETAEALLPEVVQMREFRPAAKVYTARMQTLCAADCVEFLQAHPGRQTLAQIDAELLRGERGQPELLLKTENGGMLLAE